MTRYKIKTMQEDIKELKKSSPAPGLEKQSFPKSKPKIIPLILIMIIALIIIVAAKFIISGII